LRHVRLYQVTLLLNHELVSRVKLTGYCFPRYYQRLS